jgi:hypothetical protein
VVSLRISRHPSEADPPSRDADGGIARDLEPWRGKDREQRWPVRTCRAASTKAMDRISDRPNQRARSPTGSYPRPCQGRQITYPSTAALPAHHSLLQRPGARSRKPTCHRAVRDRRLGPKPPCRRTCQQVASRNACRRFSAEFFGQSNRRLGLHRSAFRVLKSCSHWRLH